MNKMEKSNLSHGVSTAVINNIPAPTATQRIKAKGFYLYDEVLWPILHPEGEYYPQIMKALFDAVNQTSQRSSRFFAVRYDLHLKHYTDNNQVMTDFCQQLAQVLRVRDPLSFVNIFWVREHDKAAAQHYHCVVMMDGNHIRMPHVLNRLVEQVWQATTKGTVWFPKSPYYMVHRNDSQTLCEFLLRLSYFAKCATKTGISAHIPLYGRKHYKVLKRRKSVSGKSGKIRQCQPPAERYSPLPGILDPLFIGDKEAEEIGFPVCTTDSQTRSIQRLLKLYQRDETMNRPRLQPHWLRHFKHYYDYYWPCGVSVVQYCRWYHLNPSTARCYLCDYPPAVISPAILLRWLQKETQHVIR